MFRFLTAGESHGPCLTMIVEGLPAGLAVDSASIDADLRRRQGGYGRGGRMKIERDTARFLSGVRHGQTLGSPITMQIENRDWVNWEESMSAAPGEAVFEPVTRIRPGHADFTGAMKYGHQDIRNVIERSSSRETAARVAVGGLCRQLLNVFGIAIHSHVLAIADVCYTTPRQFTPDAYSAGIWEAVEASAVRCADAELTEKMIARILAEIRAPRQVRPSPTAGERPVRIGGSVRGDIHGKDWEDFAVEISAQHFYSKTFTIEHN